MSAPEQGFPDELDPRGVFGAKAFDLRYGENPHQQAAFYPFKGISSPLARLKRLTGQGLSYVNLTDINAGLEAVKLFAEPCAVVIKHNTLCGGALGNVIAQALERAIEADPVSAFGGVIVLNRTMNKEAAEVVASFKSDRGSNTDIVAAPEVDEEAVEMISRARKRTGVYRFGDLTSDPKFEYKPLFVSGGIIVQTADLGINESFATWKVVTENYPTELQLPQMRIGWKFASRIRSNTVLVMDKVIPMTRGIGAGQTSRVAATEIALKQAGEFANGGILVSDSFFPFDDSVKMAGEHQIGAIVQQGGSVNDEASTEMANRYSIAMVHTGRRAFWH